MWDISIVSAGINNLFDSADTGSYILNLNMHLTELVFCSV